MKGFLGFTLSLAYGGNMKKIVAVLLIYLMLFTNAYAYMWPKDERGVPAPGMTIMVDSKPTLVSDIYQVPIKQGSPAAQANRWPIFISNGTAERIGQTTMDSSLPVAIASDQTAIPVFETSRSSPKTLGSYGINLSATVDTGYVYRLVRHVSERTFYSVRSVVGTTNVYFVSATGVLTTDWQQVSSSTIPNVQYNGIAILGSTVILVHNQNASFQHVLRSTNGGYSWSQVTSFMAGADAISVGASGSTVLVGFNNGRIYRSTDSGASFSTYSIPAGASYIYHIVPSDTDTWFAATDAGIFKSTDDGITWTQKRPGSTYDIEALSKNNIVASEVANGGLIVYSEDGGETWSSSINHLGVAGLPTALLNFGSGIVGAISGSNSVYLSLDYGKTFQKIASISSVTSSSPYPGTYKAVSPYGDWIFPPPSGSTPGYRYSTAFKPNQTVLSDSYGNALGTSSNPVRVDPTGSTSQPVIKDTSGSQFYAVKRTDIGATSVNLAFGFTSKKVVVEVPASNTDEVVIDWTGGTAVVPAANTPGDDRIAPGRTITLDDYAVSSISVVAVSGTQSIYVRAWR